jgi:hypothetical protein
VQAAYEAMLIKSPKQAILSAWKSNKPSPTWGNYGKKRCQSPFIGDWVMDQLRVLAFFVYEITADEAGNGNTKQNNSQKNLHTHFNLQTSF